MILLHLIASFISCTPTIFFFLLFSLRCSWIGNYAQASITMNSILILLGIVQQLNIISLKGITFYSNGRTNRALLNYFGKIT